MMLHPFDRLEVSLNRSGSVAPSFRPDQFLNFDIGAAAEFLGLRWIWWREQREDLFNIVPGLDQWPALGLLRDLVARYELAQPRATRKPPGRRSTGYVGAYQLSPLGGRDWQPGGDFALFQERFQVVLRQAGAERRFSYALAGALEEMASNAVEHANAPIAPVACFEVTKSSWQFTVTDVGRGTLSSIRENRAYSSLVTETEALKLVLQDGVSRTADSGRGRGFTQVFKALVDRRASLRFRSGGATARWDGQSPTAQSILFQGLPLSREGFHISVTGLVGRG